MPLVTNDDFSALTTDLKQAVFKTVADFASNHGLSFDAGNYERQTQFGDGMFAELLCHGMDFDICDAGPAVALAA